jgi:hypothetical protein
MPATDTVESLMNLIPKNYKREILIHVLTLAYIEGQMQAVKEMQRKDGKIQ